MGKTIPIWLLTTVFLATVSLAEAQQPAKVARIGLLVPGSPSAFSTRIDAFRRGLRELGFNNWLRCLNGLDPDSGYAAVATLRARCSGHRLRTEGVSLKTALRNHATA